MTTNNTHKAGFGFKWHTLPNPTLEQSLRLKSYNNVNLLGIEPTLRFPSSPSLNINWQSRQSHNQQASYNQNYVDYLTDFSPEIRSAVHSTKPAFIKTPSNLDTGIVINFIAA